MTVRPTISIITVVRNSAATIADCIESIQAQSYPAEQIVIDGDSTDGTLAVIERYRDRLARVVSEPDRGVYDAMNKGIALATGDVIGILNADDLYTHREVLARVAEVMADERVDSCYGDLEYVKEAGDGRWAMGNGRWANREPGARNEISNRSPVTHHSSRFKVFRYWKSGEYQPDNFYWGWMPPHPTFFARRRVYEKYGLFNPALGSAADYELMLRFLLKQGVSAAYISEVLVWMRVGGISNASLANRLQANWMDRRAWEANGLKPYPWTLALKPLRKVFQWRIF